MEWSTNQSDSNKDISSPHKFAHLDSTLDLRFRIVLDTQLVLLPDNRRQGFQEAILPGKLHAFRGIIEGQAAPNRMHVFPYHTIARDKVFEATTLWASSSKDQDGKQKKGERRREGMHGRLFIITMNPLPWQGSASYRSPCRDQSIRPLCSSAILAYFHRLGWAVSAQVTCFLNRLQHSPPIFRDTGYAETTKRA